MQQARPRHALLVIDVQAGFISDYTKKALPRIHQLLVSDEFDLVLATRFFNPEASPFRRFIHWERLSSPEEIAIDSQVSTW